MSKIYVKSTTLGDEKCLVVDGREGVVYPIPFKNWKRIKVAMYFSVVPATDDNGNVQSSISSETIVVHSPRDKFYFGVKKSQDLDFPGENDEYFWGLSTVQSINTMNAPSARLDSINWCTIYPRKSLDMQGINLNYVGDGSATSNYAAYIGADFSLGEVSAALDGTTSMYLRQRNASNINNVSGSALRTETLSNAFSDVSVSNTPIREDEVPQALFIYWPWFNSKLRIHSLGVYQVA